MPLSHTEKCRPSCSQRYPFCPTQRNAGPHAHRDTPSESDTCPWRRGLLHSYKGCHVWLGRLCAAQEGLAERLALLPKARWRGGIHLWEGALLPNTCEGASCLLSPRCWGAAQGQGVPWSHLPAWASSVQAQSLCCAKPLAGLHHGTSPSAHRAPWSPPTPHTGAFPGKFQLLVIYSSGDWGRRSGAYTPSGPATHTHTQTHTCGPSVSGGPEPSTPASHLLPCSTYPCRHWARCADTEDRPSSASQNSARMHNRACVRSDTGHSTQGHPGSSWQHARAFSQHTCRTVPCGHTALRLWAFPPTAPNSQTVSDTTTPWDHTQLQSAARGPPQPAAPGHAAHRP